MTEDDYDLPRPRKDRGNILTYIKWLRDVRKRERKAMLALCAICRTTFDHILHASNRKALEASEEFADGLIGQAELDHFWRQTQFEPVVYCEWVIDAAGAAYRLANLSPVNEQDERDEAMFHQQREYDSRIRWRSEEVLFAMDVLDFNFRDTSMHDDWRTTTATAIARQMYDSREFGAMPVLADALQDAGCENADILDHCRGPGPHVRGCWVVDLVLGKE